MADPSGIGHGSSGGDQADWDFKFLDQAWPPITEAIPDEASSAFQAIEDNDLMETSYASAAPMLGDEPDGDEPDSQLNVFSGPPPDGTRPVDTHTPMGLPSWFDPTRDRTDYSVAELVELLLTFEPAVTSGRLGYYQLVPPFQATIVPNQPRSINWVLQRLESYNIQEYIDRGVDRTRRQGDLTFAEICVCLASTELYIRDYNVNASEYGLMGQRIAQGLLDRAESVFSAKPPGQTTVDYDARIVLMPATVPPDTYLILDHGHAYFPMEYPCEWPEDMKMNAIDDWPKYMLAEYTRTREEQAANVPPPPVAQSPQAQSSAANMEPSLRRVSRAFGSWRRNYSAPPAPPARISKAVSRRPARVNLVSSRPRYVRRVPRMRNDRLATHGRYVNFLRKERHLLDSGPSPPSRPLPGSHRPEGTVPSVDMVDAPSAPAEPQGLNKTFNLTLQYGARRPNTEQHSTSLQLNMDGTATNAAN